VCWHVLSLSFLLQDMDAGLTMPHGH
jgi:hypothetical protein